MNGKLLLDLCHKIIKRQDLDRPLLLFYLNSVRKSVLRSTYDYPNEQTKQCAYGENGEISVSGNSIKNVKYVEFVTDDEERTVLRRIAGYDAARNMFDFSENDNPTHYVEFGDTLILLPVPESGEVYITGEFYLPDLQDDTNPVDQHTDDIADGIIYLASAEYFDMLDEVQKGQVWRQKGIQFLNEYVKHLKLRRSENLVMMNYDPFGNLGLGVVSDSSAVVSPRTNDYGEW